MEGAADSTLVPRRPLRASRLAALVGENGLAITVVCAFAALLVAGMSRLISTDGWLALVVGRLIAERGLPSEDTLTVLAGGRDWVDQQWLAQLALYGLERVGGLELVLFVHVALVVAAFAGTVALARRRGGPPGVVAGMAAVALLPFALTTHSLRTQSLVYVGFVALLAVVTTRRPLHRRELLLVLAIVALWANLHGSVLVAAGLLSLRGLVELWERRGDSRADGWILAVAPWSCAFASPYAASLPGYYADTVLNGGFSNLVAQWQPTTLSPVSAPLFLLVLAFVFVVGRSGDAYNRYEKLAGAALLVLALLAVRHWVWFSLFALALLPRGLPRTRREQPSPGVVRINLAVATGAAALLAVVVASTAAKPASWFESAFPQAGVRAVADFARTHPAAEIYATERYADWLLWELPWLEGRLAYDARFELLERSELERLVLFRASPAFLPQTLERYELLVVDRRTEDRIVPEVLRSTRVLFPGERLVVVTRR